MSIFSSNLTTKIHTLFRSRVREGAELLIDTHAIGIFEQELMDSQESITQAKHQLTLLMAERLRLERANHKLTAQIQQREDQTLKALNNKQDDLAKALAEDIIELEQSLSQQTTVLTTLRARESKLKTTLQQRIKRLQEFQRELNMVKAVQNAHNVMRSTEAIENRGEKQSDLQGSLKRIQDLQQQVDDQHKASEELALHLDSNGLAQQLKDADLASKHEKINAVLSRIQQ